MSFTLRYFIFPEDSEPLRLSQRLVNGLVQSKDSMPQYANLRQKVMGVVLNSQDGKPIEIDRLECSIWTFDEDGEISAGLQDALAEVLNSIHDVPSASATVVSIRPQLHKKRLAEKYRWKPAPEDIDRVSRDIWPKTKADRLKDAKGTSKRKLPLTYDAKHAIGKAAEGFWKIALEIGKLKEPSLKSFISEARQRCADDLDYRHLYDALVKMGDDQLELMRRRNSGKGVWYAFIEILHSRDEGYLETIRRFHERCEGRKAAVIAARRLLAENASRFDENVSVEASVITDLEWETMAHPDD